MSSPVKGISVKIEQNIANKLDTKTPARRSVFRNVELKASPRSA